MTGSRFICTLPGVIRQTEAMPIPWEQSWQAAPRQVTQPSPALPEPVLWGWEAKSGEVSAPGWAEGRGSRALPAICSLPPLNKATQSPLIAFNHFPINSPCSRALFKAYGLESIFTKTVRCSRRWKLGGSNEKKKSSLEGALLTLAAVLSRRGVKHH